LLRATCFIAAKVLVSAAAINALESVMGTACTVFVGGLAAGNQLLALSFRQVQRIGSGFMGVTCCRAFGPGGQVAQDRLNKLVVGRADITTPDTGLLQVISAIHSD
jgi:hypothetical protein